MIVNYRKIKKKKFDASGPCYQVSGLSNGAKDTTTKTIFLQWSLSTWFYFSGIAWVEE